jgi:hypothetical protein
MHMSQEFPESIQASEEMMGQLERSDVATTIREALSREGVDEEDFNVAPETREAYALLLRWCREREPKADTDERERLQFEIERALLYRESGMPKTALANAEQSYRAGCILGDAGCDISDLLDTLGVLRDELTGA